MLKFKSRWRDEPMDAYIVVDKYVADESVYLALYCKDDEDFVPYPQPWCDITVCLPNEGLATENCAYVDVNNCPDIIGFIEENKLGEFMGVYGFSGWCSYPLYKFDMDEVSKHLLKEP